MKRSVSVIIPTYNCARFVADAIESALNQTLPPTQVIVIDDGSTDDTADVLNRFGSRIEVIRQNNAGVPAARNAGLSIARGDWVALLDADDAWHPAKLECQLAAIEAAPDVGVLGTGVVDYPVRSWTPVERDAMSTTIIARQRLLVKNPLVASSVILRRDVIDHVGEFDVNVPGVEDIDYWQRASEITHVGLLPLPLTGYRQVAGSLSRRAAVMESGLSRVLAKLDERDSWQGDRWLRRRAFAQFYYASSHLYSSSGHQRAALLRMLKSFVSYPLPMSHIDSSAARVRRSIVLLLRLVGVMPPDAGLPREAAHDA